MVIENITRDASNKFPARSYSATIQMRGQKRKKLTVIAAISQRTKSYDLHDHFNDKNIESNVIDLFSYTVELSALVSRLQQHDKSV